VETAQPPEAILCIHGYGSSGQGGGLGQAIRKFAHDRLLQNGSIRGYVYCEDLTNPTEMDNPYYKPNIDLYHEYLETHPGLANYAGNDGVTILML